MGLSLQEAGNLNHALCCLACGLHGQEIIQCRGLLQVRDGQIEIVVCRNGDTRRNLLVRGTGT
jgi:hypothetical protein